MARYQYKGRLYYDYQKWPNGEVVGYVIFDPYISIREQFKKILWKYGFKKRYSKGKGYYDVELIGKREQVASILKKMVEEMPWAELHPNVTYEIENYARE